MATTLSAKYRRSLPSLLEQVERLRGLPGVNPAVVDALIALILETDLLLAMTKDLHDKISELQEVEHTK